MQIEGRLTDFVWNGEDNFSLVTAPWKNQVKLLSTINPSRTGTLSFAPTANFNGLQNLGVGKFYRLDALSSFDLPGAEVTVGSGGGDSPFVFVSSVVNPK